MATPIELVIATANPSKAREFREMLGDSSGETSAAIRWCDAQSISPPPDVEETGKTFRANACLKAAAFARHYDRWALADDSGLEIDALDGAPGVYSARWATMNQAGSGDADNNRLVLRQMESVPDAQRTARFVCVLALADPAGRTALTARGTVDGQILREPRGRNGFGYDPLFLISSLNQTTAELDADSKHAISHRGQALRAMKELMRGLVHSR